MLNKFFLIDVHVCVCVYVWGGGGGEDFTILQESLNETQSSTHQTIKHHNNCISSKLITMTTFQTHHHDHIPGSSP